MPTYNTVLGRFIVETYKGVVVGEKAGMDCKILFAPMPTATACKVALIQIVRCTLLAGADKPAQRPFMTSISDIPERLLTPNHWHVDAKEYPSPAFGLNFDPTKPTCTGTAAARWEAIGGEKNLSQGGELRGELGWIGPFSRYALLHDHPARTCRDGRIFHHEFEIGAVCVTGKRGWYLGGLTWGYRGKRAEKTVVVETDTAAPLNKPSADWKEAAGRWNDFSDSCR